MYWTRTWHPGPGRPTEPKRFGPTRFGWCVGVGVVKLGCLGVGVVKLEAVGGFGPDGACACSSPASEGLGRIQLHPHITFTLPGPSCWGALFGSLVR